MKNQATLLRFSALFILSLLVPATFGTVAAQSPATLPIQAANSTLTVNIAGLRNAKGNILLKLSRDSNFSPIETRKVEISARTLTAQTVFNNLPHGVYAVSLIHDENKNEKLDPNFIRIPTEGYGFSNNPAKRMGMPKHEETAFTLNQPQQVIQIRVIYW